MTAKLGAPRKYKKGPAYLHVKIDPGLKREIERAASKVGTTVTTLVTAACEDALVRLGMWSGK